MDNMVFISKMKDIFEYPAMKAVLCVWFQFSKFQNLLLCLYLASLNSWLLCIGIEGTGGITVRATLAGVRGITNIKQLGGGGTRRGTINYSEIFLKINEIIFPDDLLVGVTGWCIFILTDLLRCKLDHLSENIPNYSRLLIKEVKLQTNRRNMHFKFLPLACYWT